MVDEVTFVRRSLEFLRGKLGDQAEGLTADSQLIESGLLDSLALLDFVQFIEALRGSSLRPDEISIETLSTLRSAHRLVEAAEQPSSAEITP